MLKTSKVLVLGVLVAMIGMGCEPKDENVKRQTRSPFAQAKIERANISGLDYLQYTAYRLAEVQRLAELVVQNPAPLIVQDNSPACGRLVIDKTEGLRRMMRLKTQNCPVAAVKEEKLQLAADGEEVLDVQLNSQGQVTRVLSSTVGPYVVSGEIRAGEMDDSKLNTFERREMSLDLIEGSRYRFAYAVEMSWRQELVSPSFKAYEDGGRNHINLTGEFVMTNGRLQSLTLDLARINVSSPREITERKRRANSLTPGKTFHNVNLLLTAQPGADKGTVVPMSFGTAGCGLPQGKLRVLTFKTTMSNDNLTFKQEKDVEFTPLGIHVPAVGKSQAWLDCAPAVQIPLPGGTVGGWPAKPAPTFLPSELGNRNPYLALFFK
ncbi:MAG: hypothetical protein AB7N80_02685 [Bdellovibrionales bacterium]